MIRGLTSAGLGNVESLQHMIELAGRYGFQTVDLNALELVEQYGQAGAEQQLASNGVSVGAISLQVEWRSSEEVFQEGFQQLAAQAAAAQALGCTRCCTYILPSTDAKPAHFMAVATRRLRQCAQVLGVYHIRLGLEFVGPHHLRTTWAHPFIWTQQETLDWIDAIGEPNVGLLVDAYHWYTNGAIDTDLTSLCAEQIVHVHINDAPAIPVDEVLDNGRLYPGEGVIDLNQFVNLLESIGYDGPVAQEVLTAQPPTASPEKLAQRSKLAFDKVFGSVT